MQVTFFGVRGSTPCNGDEIARFGGNTSCVALRAEGEDPLFFDLGTGARYLGAELARQGTFHGTCLLSHLHWDHTQGLPFFTPLLHDGSTLDVYAPAQHDGRTVEEVMGTVIRPPLFPVTIDEFPGAVRFHDTTDCTFHIGGLKVMARVVPHVGATLGYRVECDGRSVAYLSDHQQPHDGSFAISDGARELAEGVDLLIHDAQYTPTEFAVKSTWGHCTVDYALWVAQHCQVGKVALYHHDPTRTDNALDETASCAKAFGDKAGFQAIVASEGLTLDV